jgi:hypothetical protein
MRRAEWLPSNESDETNVTTSSLTPQIVLDTPNILESITFSYI